MSVKIDQLASDYRADLQKSYTLAEYEFVANLDYGYELDEGKLAEMSPTKRTQAKTISFLVSSLYNFVRANQAGTVLPGGVGCNLFPEAEFDKKTVRAPDVVFLSSARLAKGDINDNDWIPGPPDLAVEVISPAVEPDEIKRKIQQYQQAKTALIWVVDPKKKIVLVYRSGQETPQELALTDLLDGGEILPGFQLEVKEIFG